MIKTPVRFIDENKITQKKIKKLWNKTLGKIGLKIKKKNSTLSAMKKMFFGNPHKPHKQMLNYGIDGYTLKLYLNKSDKKLVNILDDLVKMMVATFKGAESNDRTVESSHFTFIFANGLKIINKSEIVNNAIYLGVIIYLFVN